MHNTSVAVCDWDGRSFDIAIKASWLGFDRAILCVEDRHVLWRQDNVKEAVDDFLGMGMDVAVSPWGVGGKFAGESTPSNEESAFEDWVKLALETNASTIMLDEPRSTELISDFAKNSEINRKKMLAIQPENGPADWSGSFQEISVSTYLFGRQMSEATEESLEEHLSKWTEIMPEGSSAWVQAWGVPEGKEWVPAYLIERWQELGFDVNIWAYDAFATVSSKRPDNPELVWGNIIHVLG